MQLSAFPLEFLPGCNTLVVFLIIPLPLLGSFVEHNTACVLTKIYCSSLFWQSENVHSIVHGFRTQPSHFYMSHFFIHSAYWTVWNSTFLWKEFKWNNKMNLSNWVIRMYLINNSKLLSFKMWLSYIFHFSLNYKTVVQVSILVRSVISPWQVLEKKFLNKIKYCHEYLYFYWFSCVPSFP